MSLEPPAIRLVREALEERLPPRDAATALFAALTEWGPRVPTAHDEILELIRGPLERALSNRMGAREARIVLDSISEIVVNSEEPTGSYGSVSTTQTDSVATRRVSRDELTASLDPDDRITEVVSTVKTGRVRLVVASASDGFAGTCNSRLGASYSMRRPRPKSRTSKRGSNVQRSTSSWLTAGCHQPTCRSA